MFKSTDATDITKAWSQDVKLGLIVLLWLHNTPFTFCLRYLTDSCRRYLCKMEGHSTSEYHHFQKAREGWLACSHNPHKVLWKGDYQYHHSCVLKSCLRKVFPYRHKQQSYLWILWLMHLSNPGLSSSVELHWNNTVLNPKRKINDHIQKQLN